MVFKLVDIIAYYLTEALWPVSSKAIQFAKSAILSAHSLCRATSGGVRLDVLCPCLCCAVRHCQIQNNLKDKLPCLDSSASLADQAHHAVRVKICVKTSCPR